MCDHVVPDLQRLKPIPIAEFSEVVKKKHFNANIAFEDEFAVRACTYTKHALEHDDMNQCCVWMMN